MTGAMSTMPGGQQRRRLLPRTEQLAPGDAVDPRLLEDDLLREVERDLHRPAARAATSGPRAGASASPGRSPRGRRTSPGRRPRPSRRWPSRTAATGSSREGSISRSAPISFARPRRKSLGSTAITVRAPAARQIPTANSPMGPAPSTATVEVAISGSALGGKTVCTALPNGSIADAVSAAILGSTSHALCAGNTRKSANAPSTSTPRIRMFWQMCGLPVRHSPQCPQNRCVSAATNMPGQRMVDLGTDGDDVSGHLVAERVGESRMPRYGGRPTRSIRRYAGRCRRSRRHRRGSGSRWDRATGRGLPGAMRRGPTAVLRRARMVVGRSTGRKRIG